ncbi:hypothetical protein [Frateuria sp. YIM B11624]|uniref:hypothetical protein n=1 Tax=Frateuria sp. YIM B11624 TaxID=3143185 RepID=UPI003C735BCC
MIGFLVAAIVLAGFGGYLIPTTLGQAQSPLAPYRALRGAIYFAIAVVYFLVWRGDL